VTPAPHTNRTAGEAVPRGGASRTTIPTAAGASAGWRGGDLIMMVLGVAGLDRAGAPEPEVKACPVPKIPNTYLIVL